MIASVYDPIGCLQPLVIMLKILFQEIFKVNIKWNNNIVELVNKWDEIIESLASLEIIYFKRCYYLHYICDPVEKYHLHGFSNASDSAYAAVVYCHFKVENSSFEQIHYHTTITTFREFYFVKSNS